MRQVLKTHSYFLLLFGSLFFVFFWPLLIGRAVFIRGDNAVQFYPWAFYYSESLKAGTLPYWTTLMGNGFPLVAEGQTAPYYLPNLLFYRWFPFRLVYAWIVPLHSLLGGLGFYLYAQRAGLKKEGAALSATLFSFSSAYGGCFYTLGTLQVLTWLPWCLLLLEKMVFETRAKMIFYYISCMGILLSQMWAAGFPQAALYAHLYLCLLAVFHKTKRVSQSIGVIIASLLGIALALPQLLSTLELAAQSVRQGESLSFALWGSVPPPALISLLFPSWGIFLRVSFYVGVLPFFLIASTFFVPKPRIVRVHLWLALFFVFLALGKYNPIYEFLVNAMSLTFLRNPAKFLFFSVISLAFVAGYGLDLFLEKLSSEKITRRLKIAIPATLLLVAAIPWIAQKVYHLTEKYFVAFGNRYAESIFHEKTQPLHSLTEYQARMTQMLNELGNVLAPENGWNLLAVFLAALTGLLLLRVVRGKIRRRTFLAAVWMLVFLDLYLFGHFFGYGFVGNVASDAIAPKVQTILEKIKDWQASQGGLVLEYARPGSEILEPNSQMRHSIAHAGAYSPLLLKRTYELIKDLGIADSSLGRPPFTLGVWVRERKLLDLLGVNLVLADQDLDLPGLKLLQVIEGRRFYKNADALPILFALFDWKIIPDRNERLNYLKSASFDPSKVAVLEEPVLAEPKGGGKTTVMVKVTEQKPEGVKASVTLDESAILVFRSSFYPRWRAEVDGASKKIFPVDHALSGIFIEPGRHEVRFYYDKRTIRWVEIFSFGLLVFILAANLAFLKKEQILNLTAAAWIIGVFVLYGLFVVLPKLKG